MLKRLLGFAWIVAGVVLIVWMVYSGFDPQRYTRGTIGVFAITMIAGLSFAGWHAWKAYRPGMPFGKIILEFTSIGLLTSLFAVMAFAGYAVPR